MCIGRQLLWPVDRSQLPLVVGEKSAIQLLGELLVLSAELRAKQWVAMAGLDPRYHQSGTSVEKKALISKVGNRYLRIHTGLVGCAPYPRSARLFSPPHRGSGLEEDTGGLCRDAQTPARYPLHVGK